MIRLLDLHTEDLHFSQDSSPSGDNYEGMVIEGLKSNMHGGSAVTAGTISLQVGREGCACLSTGRAGLLAGTATSSALNLPEICPVRVIWLI